MTWAVLFPLGETVITANASLRLTTEEVLSALQRHAAGDFLMSAWSSLACLKVIQIGTVNFWERADSQRLSTLMPL